MNIDVQQILIQSITTSLILSVIAYLFRNTLVSWIGNRIKHSFDIRLVDYKTKEDRRLKAVVIAELISEWSSEKVDYKKLNRLTYEAFIWLPEDIVIDLSNMLAKVGGSKSAKEILVNVRKELWGIKDKVTADQIIHFPTPSPSVS